jgi:single-stranded-DNA-specific exonuclease
VNAFWKIYQTDQLTAADLARELSISSRLAQLLLNRGISDPESARLFLKPALSSLRDPFLFKDMDRAVNCMINAITGRKKIVIYGDFDVDGITSTAIITDFLRQISVETSFFIPGRMTDGYGLNMKRIEEIVSQGARLIIAVDCGAKSRDEAEYLRQKGVDLLVLDHHDLDSELPDVAAMINPQRKDCAFPFKEMASVGLAFYFLIALRRSLREKDFFRGIEEPCLEEYLDIVALGTIADIVPLTDENRIFVSYGLKSFGEAKRPGIRALKRVSQQVDGKITSWNVAFQYAPRLNASGRLSSAAMGVKLLLCRDDTEALSIASELDLENRRRQEIEKKILDEAKSLIEKQGYHENNAIVVAKEGWHQGVVGIVAQRLVEAYYRPAAVIALENGVGVGSLRSIAGFNLSDVLESMRHFFIRFGGHAKAAGLKIAEANIPLFREEFSRKAGEILSNSELAPSIRIDFQLNIEEATENFINEISMLEPFGTGNPEPVFKLTGLRVEEVTRVGPSGNHMRLQLKSSGRNVNAMWFRMGEASINPGEIVDMAANLRLEEWQGRKYIKLMAKDIRKT